MTALPAATAWTNGSATEGDFKTAQTNLRDFLAGLLGADGTQATALETLGSLLSKTVAKTANYTVLATDRGKLIDCTSGTFTLTLTAAATLGDGFAFGVKNSGTGVITIDPNGSETVDGVATITLAAGESCLMVCNGTLWRSVAKSIKQGTLLKFSVITASNASWATQAATKNIVACAVGGGSGGAGGSGSGGVGEGGHCGSTVWGYTTTISSTYSVTIGAGSSGGLYGSASSQGGTTSFGSVASAVGGIGALPLNITSAYGFGGETGIGVGGIATGSTGGAAGANSAAGGASGRGSAAGGNGGSGIIFVWEFA